MNDQQKQLIERLKQAQNVLVTVSKNPSVDQLSAAIGLTLALNKLDKHATAVYSGETPSTIDFLKPEETLEENTDSLRDFIIALDKSKADKLRYKVEDQVVRIFITPYRTSISEKDLDFSQGDFNVDVVVALGVQAQQDLDDAVQAHGRILHDATVASVSVGGATELGTINWVDQGASSLSEMVSQLLGGLDQKIFDSQIATALLTGIVATTERFSNEKTSPNTMTVSAALMAAGANQQLIATELQAPAQASAQVPADTANEQAPPENPPESNEAPAKDPGTLEIEHENAEPSDVPPEQPEQPEQPGPDEPQLHVDEEGNLVLPPSETANRDRMVEPPSIDSVLSANTTEEELSPGVDELTQPTNPGPILSHNERVISPPPDQPEPSQPDTPEAKEPAADLPSVPADDSMAMPAPAMPEPPTLPAATSPASDDHRTLSDIEAAVHSPHLEQLQQEASAAADSIDDARNAVEAAFKSSPTTSSPEPISALNAQPLSYELHGDTPDQQPPAGPGLHEPSPGDSPADQTLDMPMPPSFGTAPASLPQPQGSSNTDDSKAPPVPPPFVPPLN